MSMHQVRERFNSKVKKRADDECWEWLGTKLRTGHGQFYINGKRVNAHRVAMIFSGREIPRGLIVCHKCNNPSCVNVAHLYIGTAKDNARDSINAKTFKYPHPGFGEKHHSSKMTKTQVAEAIRRKKNGESLRKIASEYNVSPSALSKVWRGETWV